MSFQDICSSLLVSNLLEVELAILCNTYKFFDDCSIFGSCWRPQTSIYEPQSWLDISFAYILYSRLMSLMLAHTFQSSCYWPISSSQASATRSHFMISVIIESEITSPAALFCDIGALNIYVRSNLISTISFQSWAKFVTGPNKMMNKSY